MSAALIHLFCPACGQAFLTHAQHALSVQSCPHCAYTGTAGQFIGEDASTTAGLDIRRREHVRRAPTAPMAAANPHAWVVRTYEPIVPAPVAGATPGPLVVPSFRYDLPRDPQWETMQAFAAAPSYPSPPVVEARPAGVPIEPAAQPKMVPWSPMKAPGTRKLTPWPSLDIASTGNGPSGGAEYFVPRRKRSFIGLFIVLVALVLTGVVGALWLDKESAARANAWLRMAGESIVKPRSEVASKPPAPEPATVEPEIRAAVPLAPENALTPVQAASQIDALLRTMAAATTIEARLDCIANGPHFRDSVEAFFKQASGPLQITQLRPLPSAVQALPGKYPVTLCVVTAVMADGPVNGLVRLAQSPDGSLKLDWPTLNDSLLRKLTHYAKTQQTSPEWMTIGVRRNFGFEETAEVREKHFVFDIQGLGDGSDHMFAVVPKDNAVGRSLDDTLSWNQLYIVRALVHWTTAGDRPRITLLDAELVPTGVASR